MAGRKTGMNSRDPIKTFWALLALPLAVSTGAAKVTLVENGEARAVVVVSETTEILPSQLDEFLLTAAGELVDHVRSMTGAELPVVDAAAVPDGLLPVYLGGAADSALDEASRAAGVNPSTFTLRVRDDRIDIRGLSDEGTLFGVYELLEQIGFRWYMPGEAGTVIPEGDTIAVDLQTETQAPSMQMRLLQKIGTDWPWARRARLGGDRRSTGTHGIPGLPRNRQAFEADPDMFSLIGDERRARQDCLSNPKVLEQATRAFRARLRQAEPGEKVYVGAASHDGGGYCECEDCKALDQGVYDPLADRESMTDRYIWFFNRILENLEQDFPEHRLHIVHYTYGAHMMPPAIEMDPRIVPVFAPITLDRVRGMDNPMSPDRHLLRWLVDEYAERGVNEMYYRGYYNNLACPGFPFSQIDRIRNEIPALAEQGITVMRVEVIRPNWSTDFLNLYLAPRVMWDIETEVDAVLDEFYRLYYGPAEAPMREYHEQLESAFRDTPYLTGGSALYFPLFLGHPRRDALRALLDEAQRLAAEEGGGRWSRWVGRLTGRDPADPDDEAPNVYTLRIDKVRLGWDRMDLFLDMIEARNHHDFATAHQKMEAFDEITELGAATRLGDWELMPGRLERRNPALINLDERKDSRPASYFNRFWRGAVAEGYRRAVDIGDIVATLPDEWWFLLDPAEIGEISGWHRPGELGGNWQPMKTSSRSWSDQGLHYYKGIAWYRQRVDIPAEYAGRPLYLWFGGVDRLAHVWINGQFVGTSREPEEGLPGVPGSFRPFDMPATHAVRYGEENWIVVRIENRTLAELGTGGIMAPVMFWSPRDPEWKP